MWGPYLPVYPLPSGDLYRPASGMAGGALFSATSPLLPLSLLSTSRERAIGVMPISPLSQSWRLVPLVLRRREGAHRRLTVGSALEERLAGSGVSHSARTPRPGMVPLTGPLGVWITGRVPPNPPYVPLRVGPLLLGTWD